MMSREFQFHIYHFSIGFTTVDIFVNAPTPQNGQTHSNNSLATVGLTFQRLTTSKCSKPHYTTIWDKLLVTWKHLSSSKIKRFFTQRTFIKASTIFSHWYIYVFKGSFLVPITRFRFSEFHFWKQVSCKIHYKITHKRFVKLFYDNNNTLFPVPLWPPPNPLRNEHHASALKWIYFDS